MKGNISLKEAVRFHGHLGPYLVLGLLAGKYALKKLKAKKYFGIVVFVRGATQKPKSCFIDGLQLSTGATCGKGNIQKSAGKELKVLFRNLDNNKRLNMCLDKKLIEALGRLKAHRDSEALARKLYKANPATIFKLTTND